jgi:hypothetical protein
MDHETIKTLLDKYWLAETSVEEEKVLASYFRGRDIDPRLEPFRDLFAYFDEEARVIPGKDLESRILEQILREEGAPHGMETPSSPAAAPVRPLHRLSVSFAAAASVILLIGAYLMYQPVRHAAVPGTDATGNTTGVTTGVPTSAVIKDTYDDPQEALAAIRHALLTASVRMNQGKDITQKNMERLGETWQKTKNL